MQHEYLVAATRIKPDAINKNMPSDAIEYAATRTCTQQEEKNIQKLDRTQWFSTRILRQKLMRLTHCQTKEYQSPKKLDCI